MHCLIQYKLCTMQARFTPIQKQQHTEVMKYKLVDMKSQSENDHVMFIRHENRQQCTIDITYGQTEKQ